MKRLAELILYPILAFAALVLALYLAYLGPVASRLLLIVLALAGIVASCYAVHWFRYPGIFKTKSPLLWLGHIGLATLLLVLAPLIAVFELTHFTHFLAPVMKLQKLLGLDFRFEPGERVQVRANAPVSVPGEMRGTIISVRVLRGVDFNASQGAQGPILYLVQLDDGMSVEIAEQFLKETGRGVPKTAS